MERPKIQQQFSDLKVSRWVAGCPSWASQQRTDALGHSCARSALSFIPGGEEGPCLGVLNPTCVCRKALLPRKGGTEGLIFFVTL